MNIQDIITRASELRIAVVGDLITDEYVTGVVERISPEAPIQILRVTGRSTNPGGAGNVVENLRRLGCEVSFFHQERVPTKTRVMSGGHHLLRIDDEQEPEWMRWEDVNIGLPYGIENKKFNCVIISDYSKGMISKEVAEMLIELCRWHEIPVVVDSKHYLERFEGATTVKCNDKEWRTYVTDMGTGEGDEGIYLSHYEVGNLVVTAGNRGMRYFGKYGGCELSGIIPAIPVAISDTCGAGDTVTAVLGIMTALGEPIDSACELANIAAAEVCKFPGVKPIDKEMLLKHEVNP